VRLVTFEQLPSFGINVSKSTIYRLERLGQFPLRVRPTPRTCAWIESEILAYVEQRANARPARKAA
jgi:predicted DNA-binding transcriptional regulator AlpA